MQRMFQKLEGKGTPRSPFDRPENKTSIGAGSERWGGLNHLLNWRIYLIVQAAERQRSMMDSLQKSFRPLEEKRPDRVAQGRNAGAV